jgi:hypothetical protein
MLLEAHETLATLPSDRNDPPLLEIVDGVRGHRGRDPGGLRQLRRGPVGALGLLEQPSRNA